MASYDTGYKRPPKHTQFKKGQSGNPKGRPKGVKNIATDIKEELEEFVQITEGNKTFLVTKQRALIKALLSKASKGDVRAAQTLLGLKAEVDHREQEQGTEAWLEEEDLQIIEQFQARQAQAREPTEGADDADE
jgi:hypothetical protein